MGKVLVIANEPDYVGAKTNGRFANAPAGGLLIVIVVASVAADPLMIWTKAGR